jgi:membrane protease YdiL (CAAX protease family)
VSRVLGPIVLLCAVYLATVFCLEVLAAAVGWPWLKWIELLGIVVATGVVIALVERGRWSLGLAIPPRIAAAELLGGMLFAAILIVAADRLIALSEPLRHARGSGFPWLELVAVFVPAALHEELMFRGYVYQKLRTWSRAGAIAITSGLFAALHGGNGGVTPIAMANLLLAGVLLALAYERRRHLWLPIGIHIGWNVASGPLLGYGVSGYVAGMTVMTTSAAGPPWITGGAFGIEGSVWMVAVEVVGIAVLLKKR